MVPQIHTYDSPRSKKFLKRTHSRLLRRLARRLLEDAPRKATKGWWY